MKKLVIIITLVIILIFIIPVAVSQKFRNSGRITTNPVTKVFFWLGQKIRYPIDWTHEIGQIRDENNSLKIRVAKLSSQVVKLEELKKENQNLRSELALRPDVERFQRVVATVISYGLPGNLQTIVIDQGKKSGINPGDAVVSSGYLVGKVSEVFSSSANVILITNQDSIIQAQITGSGEKGIVSGSITGVYISDLKAEIQVDAGTIVETSGLGGSMPSGLLIGETTDQKSTKEQAKNSVRLRSKVNLNNLDVVFVLTKIKEND